MLPLCPSVSLLRQNSRPRLLGIRGTSIVVQHGSLRGQPLAFDLRQSEMGLSTHHLLKETQAAKAQHALVLPCFWNPQGWFQAVLPTSLLHGSQQPLSLFSTRSHPL